MSLYLVTGGAGFIGSHLAEELTRRGERVRVADSFITGKRQNLAHLPGIELIEGDLADLAVARSAVAGVDYVLHEAAVPSVPRSVEDPLTSNRANIDATLNVLVAARDARVKRVVYAGSSSAYGDTPTLPKQEDMPTRPQSPYALQKLVAVLRRHFGLHTGAAGQDGAHDLRRRGTDSRFHLCRQRRRRRTARLHGRGVRDGVERGHWISHFAERSVPGTSRARRKLRQPELRSEPGR